MDKKEKPMQLNAQEISEGASKGLGKYENLKFFEQYAMYMGVVQLLELGLKELLEQKFGYDIEILEKHTLGVLKKELIKNELRSDFIELLGGVVESRNYIAHEILANESILNGMLSNSSIEGSFTKNKRFLWKAIHELEELCFLFDWTNKNNGWD